MSIVVLIIIAITCIFSYMGFNNTALFEKYKFNVGAIANRKEYIRLISSAFLHADFMHLFFNMLSLYFFQGVVIHFFGEIGFLIVYFGSMILGNVFSLQIYQKQIGEIAKQSNWENQQIQMRTGQSKKIISLS